MSDTRIEVSIDEKAFRLEMAVFSKQIPYATALAINAVATDAQKGIREHINEAFTVRRKPWIEKSVKVSPFAKKDSLKAVLMISPPGGESRDVLSQHEEGGDKVSNRAGGKVAVPTENIRSSVTKIVPKAKRPRNLKNSFKVTAKGGDKEYIFEVKGRGKNKKTQLAYVLEDKVPLKPRLEFVATAEKIISANWEKRFNESWEKAVNTALTK